MLHIERTPCDYSRCGGEPRYFQSFSILSQNAYTIPVTRINPTHAGLFTFSSPWSPETKIAVRMHPDRITSDGCGATMIALRNNTIPRMAAAHRPGSLSLGATKASPKEINAAALRRVVWKRNLILSF